jgi:hypothetical protein
VDSVDKPVDKVRNADFSIKNNKIDMWTMLWINEAFVKLVI